MIKSNADLNISNIKLIIWDLDNTFWNGTITERGSKIQFIDENINFIKNLTDIGVMNSICSKNDYTTIKNTFENNNLNEIWQYFLFPSINWEPKGQRIKEIIKKIQLREENILFIDDNNLNLEEAKYYCPKINVAMPDIIPLLISQLKTFEKNDIKHKRLKRYKILEEKYKERKKFGSNDNFLYSSNIRVNIESNCIEYKERILELINRTNQLNFTKKRINQQELDSLLNDTTIESRYITVNDKYGDYGICGFYSLNKTNNSLVHFLFSCSIMSMGIEQYIYSYLEFPNIKIEGEVSVQLEKDKYCKWINQVKKEINNHGLTSNGNNRYKILFQGPCDMRGVAVYLNSNYCNIDFDFSYLDSKGKVRDHSHRILNVVNSHKLTDAIKQKILNDADFLTDTLYTQNIFNKQYDIIVFSLLLDSNSMVYKHKETGEKIAWNDYGTFTNKNNYQNYINFCEAGSSYVWTEEKLKSYICNFDYCGYMSIEEIIKDIEYMINNVSSKTKWIFIIPANIKPSKEQMQKSWFCNRYNNRKKYVPKILKYLKSKQNVKYVKLNNIIHSNKDYLDTMDHYDRFIYYKLAKEIAKKINELLKRKEVYIKSSFSTNSKLSTFSLLKKFTRIFLLYFICKD